MDARRARTDGGVAVARADLLEALAYPALLGGLALFTALIVYEGIGEVTAALGVAGWGLVWVALYHLVPMAADAAGWHRLVGAERRLPFGTMLRARWLGESINGLLPVMQVGGNVVKARLVAKRGVPGVEAGASVVVDVTLVSFTQVIFTLIGIAVLMIYLRDGQIAIQGLSGIILLGLGAACFYMIQRRGAFGVAARLLARVASSRDLVSVTGGAVALDAAVEGLYRDRRAILAAGSWHLLSWAVGVGEVWLVLMLLGHRVGWLDALLLESLGQAVRAAGFFIPGALGVQEGGYLALGRLLGLGPETSLALSLSKRARELMLGVPGLMVWQLQATRPTPLLDRRHAPDAHPNRAHRFQPTALIRAVNTNTRTLQRAGVPAVRLDADELLDEACRRTKLTDFGDASFAEPLRLLVDAYDTEADLTFVGRMAARHDTLRFLETRLRLEEDRKRHPEIAAEQIRQPLFITGLPRTGTTLLHELLTQDPANRVPLGWDSLYPSPPPDRARYDRSWRIVKAHWQLRSFDLLAPDLKVMHPLGARIPQECLVITGHSFRSYQFQTTHHVPSYQRWLEAEDLRPAYEYHRRFLQQLQWRCPGDRWVLKAPGHLFGIDAIFDSYPDAGVVLTHRDPLEVVASLASLTATLRGAFSDQIDPVAIGREMTTRWADGLARALRARDAMPAKQDRFFDVRYRDLVRDPIGTVRRIYAHYRIPFTADFEARLEAFLAENPKDKHGRHRYSLEQFGLRAEEERRRYAAYGERFGL
ncbi:MAG: sulfotransferase [Candidatus Binatia bacterium]